MGLVYHCCRPACAHTDSMPVRLHHIVADAHDLPRLARFRAQAPGWKVLCAREGEIVIGAETVHYGHLPQAHTDGDLYVHLKKADVLVTGGEKLAVAAFRRLPATLLAHGGSRILSRVLARVATTGAARAAARLVPIGVGVAAGAGFDWLTVTALGRAAVKYYGPGGPAARPLLLAGEDPAHVKLRR